MRVLSRATATDRTCHPSARSIRRPTCISLAAPAVALTVLLGMRDWSGPTAMAAER